MVSSSLRDFLTGFHKRKVERRKAAVAEIRKKIKEEQIRVRVEVSVDLKVLTSVTPVRNWFSDLKSKRCVSEA